MNILEQAKEFYDTTKGDMFKDLSAYAAYGYVFITPQTMLLGKAEGQILTSILMSNGVYLHQMLGM